MGSVIQFTAGRLLVSPAPLFEKERNTGRMAAIADPTYPLSIYWSRMMARFAADNDPINAGSEIGIRTQIFKERLNGQKPTTSRGIPKRVHSREAMLLVFNGHSPPDILQVGCPVKLASQEVAHAAVCW